MSATSVIVELEPSLLAKLDDFVQAHVFRSRNDAMASALREKIERLESRARLLSECEKLDPVEERELAEEWLDGEREIWTAS